MTVLEPITLQALSAALAEHPDALLVAGGTQVMRSPARHAEGRPVISLRQVEGFGRVSRSQRFLDVGAAVTLSRVLSIGPRVVPRVLFGALKATASPTVRVLATLGGNVCAPGVEHTSLAALAALDAALELRRGSGVRVVPAGLFWRGANDRVLQAGEVLTRIRIPLADAEHGQYVEEQVQWRGETARVGFAAVAALHKGAVEEFRLCVSSPWFGTLRFGDLESACVGLRPPLRDRTVEDLLSVLRRSATQRLGAPIPEVAEILAAILRQTGRILRLLDRSGEGEPPGLRRIARPAAAGGASENREP